jgi:3-hydroxy-9,10-secoandrosta-1,3,5(10)-triene-9,17-dione monooxygenase reductase component
MLDTMEYRHVMGHFATGVVVLTGLDGAQPAGMTCQSFVSLSLDPPLILVAPAKSSTSWPKVSSSDHFAVNMLSADQEGLARHFAVSGGDKFAGVEWEPSTNGAPRLPGILAWIDATVKDVFPGGDHLLVTARVTDFSVVGGGPLLFYKGAFKI